MSSPPCVLIIEDDPVFRRVLGFTVAKSGLAIETANDGEAGFQRLVQGGVDFFVTDHQMPRCGGVELLERLGQLEGFTRPPAILCTAKGLELDTEQLRKDFGLVGILHKPFSPRKLSELILSHLEQFPSTASTTTGFPSLTPLQSTSELGSAFSTQAPRDA